MASDSTVLVRILGESSGLGGAVTSAIKKLELFKASTSSLKVASAAAGLALGGVLVGGMVASVKVAEQGQVAQARLVTAVKDTGQAYKNVGGALDSVIDKGRKWGWSNDDSRAALVKLELATHNTGQAVKDYGLASDLARAKGMDLGSASQMIARAFAGNTRAATQLGIAVIPLTTHLDALKEHYKEMGVKTIPAALTAEAKLQDKYATGAEILQKITERVKGQSAAYANTAAGGMAQFHAQMGAMEESLGSALLPALTDLSGDLAVTAGWLARHPSLVRALAVALGVLAVALIAVSIASKLAFLASPIGIVIIALAALAVGLYYAWEHFKTFRDTVKEVWSDVKTVTLQVWGVIGPFVTNIVNTMRIVIQNQLNLIIGIVRFAMAIMRGDWSGAWNALLGILRSMWNTINGVMQGIPGKIVGAFGNLATDFYNLATGAVDSFVDGIKAKLGWLGTAIGWVISKLGAVAKWLGLGSPSARFRYYGEMMMQGLHDGVKKRGAKVLAQVQAQIASATHPTSVAAAAAAAPGAISGNVALGKSMAAAYGWNTGQEWNSLYALWEHESGWSTTAQYPGTTPWTGAYGIPQSDPGSKMAASGADWLYNPATQIKWGLGYIHGQYGDPIGAWAQEVGSGFKGYRTGGFVDSVPIMATPGELVLTEAMQSNLAGKIGGGQGDISVSVTVNGFVGNEAQLATQVRDMLVRMGRRETGFLGGLS